MAQTRCPICLHVQDRMKQCEWCLSYLYTAEDEKVLRRWRIDPETDPTAIEDVRQSEVNRFKPKVEQ